MQNQEQALQVQCFGNFSIRWNNQPILGGAKSTEAQYQYLIQILLHFRERGVSRAQLMELLFYERDVKDSAHSLRALTYNTRRKLRAAGLPDADYIVQRGGSYYWTDQIPVQEDAAEFEKLCMLAQSAEDPAEKLAYCLDACDRYTGEFLTLQASVIWVAQEARRYRELFGKCVEYAAARLKEQREFLRLEALGQYAANVEPFMYWERIVLEALIGMRQIERARHFYLETEHHYLEEMNLPMNQAMRMLKKQIEAKCTSEACSLQTIRACLAEHETGDGGYLCSYQTFKSLYHINGRLAADGQESGACLMLCTFTDSGGRALTEGEIPEGLARQADELICGAVRQTDAVCRYPGGQYLVLLNRITLPEYMDIQKRMNERLRGICRGVRIRFHSDGEFPVPNEWDIEGQRTISRGVFTMV